MLRFLSATMVLACSLSAQATTGPGAGSPRYFSESSTTRSGDAAGSATYAVQASVGEQEPGSASSATYTVSGGFTAMLGQVDSKPWLAGTNRHFTMPLLQEVVWLNGARLALAGAPTVAVGGLPATVVARSDTDVAIEMPSGLTPGWHSVALTNARGSSSIERGVGVLPMLLAEGAPASNGPFDLIFKGTQNDMVVWALGFSGIPAFPIAPYLHGLTINPAPLIRILPSFRIADPSGEFRLSIPPVPFNFPIHVQALMITSNPGYAPGSFTNRMVFQ